jgi:hypothetical protein
MSKKKTTINSHQKAENIREQNDVISTKNLKFLNENTDDNLFENFLQSI